jgi:cytochrome c oxidase cbb3-type subunit III
MGPRVKIVLFILLTPLLVACQPEAQEAMIEDSSAQVSALSIESAEAAEARLLATFPAQQRAPADPALIAQGELIYGINCRACHGVDLRGGDLGGPNLLRSQLVLNDQEGELISPVVREGRNNPGMGEMPPQALSDDEIASVATYIHSVVATSQRQGAPPPGEEIVLNILVGDPEAGQQYFQAECSGCHSIDGDLQGIASKIPEPMDLQDSWVAGRRRGAPDPDADPSRTQVMVTVNLSSGEAITGELGRIDDFLVSLTTSDGQYRSFTLHENTSPSVLSVVKQDPMERHRKLLSEYTDDIMHDVTAYLVTLK